MRDIANNVTSVGLLASHSRYAASTAITGSAVDGGEARKLYAMLNVGLGDGAGATLGKSTVYCEIQETNDTTGTWTTLHTFDSKDSTVAAVVDLTPTMRYIRASASVATEGSGQQTINFSVWGIFYDERYRPSNVG